MAATIESSSNNYPLFGISATIALAAGGGNLNWLFQSATVDADAKRVEIADGIGETKARVWADTAQQKTLTCEVIITGADASGAQTANAQPSIGTKYVITSTANSAIAGNWTLDKATPSMTNTGVVTWSMQFKPTL